MNEVSQAAAEAFKAAIASDEVELERVRRCACGAELIGPTEAPAANMRPRAVRAANVDGWGGSAAPGPDERSETLSTFDRFGMPFSTIICRRCGLVRLDPFIAETSLATYYERFYHPLHFGLASLEDRPALFMAGHGHRIWALVEPHCQPSKVRVLEVGAGTGSILSELQIAAQRSGRTVECLGTELSHECIRVGTSRGVPLIYGAFDEVIATGRRFDVVILSHVFEHFTDLSVAIDKLRRVLAEGGIVYIEVPGIMMLHERPAYRFDYARYVTHAHVFHFNLTSLASVLGAHGFSLLSGNENVESVFTVGSMTVDTDRNYCDVTAYLRFVAQNGPRLREAHTERVRRDAEHAQALQREARATAKVEADLAALKATKSWQLTEPLRQLQRWARRASR